MRPALRALLVWSLAAGLAAGTATIDANAQLQFIRGFGASSAWSDWGGCPCATNAFINTNADQYFGTGNGQIGLSMLRTRIPPDGNFAGNVPPMLAAQARGVTQIWSTAWTPPPQWKSANVVHNQNGEYLLPANYQNYANYLRDYVLYLRNNHGIDLYAISPANEPDYQVGYDGCTWSGAQLRDFVRDFLGPTFQAAGITTRIVVGESFNSSFLPVDPTLNDPAARQHLFAAAVHIYGVNPIPYPLAATHNKEYWQTERSNLSPPYDAGMPMALTTARWIHDGMVNANYNAFHYWWLASDENNEGLRGVNNGVPKRFWAFGNYSKFVRPGFHRVQATAGPAANVYVSAYRQAATGQLVIVAINQNASASSVNFQVNNSAVASVVPWITDATRDLASQTAVALSGGAFSYSLPANSVVSFVGSPPAGTPTRTPTYAGTSTRTPTATPTPGTELFDDFEDGNTANNWGGTWAAYQGGSSTMGITVGPTGAPGSTLGRLQATGTINDYGGVTATFSPSPRDLSGYVGIQFQVRGSGTYWWQVATAGVTDGDHFGAAFAATGTWTTVTIYFNALNQRGWGAPAILNLAQSQLFQWASNGNGAFNLEIDDVRLLTYAAQPTASRTASPTASRTASPTASRTASPTASRTATPSVTSSPTSASSPSPTATPSVTATRTPSPTASRTATPSVTSSPTSAPPSPTATPSVTATRTPSPTASRSATPSASPTAASTASRTATASPSFSPTPAPGSPTATPSATATRTPSPTATRSATPSASPTATPTTSRTATATALPSFSASPTPMSGSPTASRTATPVLPTATPAPPSPTQSSTPAAATATFTPLPSSPTATATPAPSSPTETSTPALATATFTPLPSTPTATPDPPSPTATATMAGPSSTPTATGTSTASATGTSTATPSRTGTPTRTASSTASATPSASPAPSSTATPLPATPTRTPTALPTADPTFTLTPAAPATATPAPQASGPLVIEAALPWPNPNPQAIAVRLSGPADSLSLKVYTPAWVLVAQAEAGPQGAGWGRISLPAELVQAPAGLYYFVVQARAGERESLPRKGRFLRLR